jgi:hypothetical protein
MNEKSSAENRKFECFSKASFHRNLDLIGEKGQIKYQIGSLEIQRG